MASELETSTDPQALAQAMVGKKCWRVAFAYPSDLHLHCGARIPYRSPKMAGQTKGAWRLATTGTRWQLTTPKGKVDSTAKQDDRLAEQLRAIEGSTIERFQVRGNVLTIAFDNQCRLQIIPSPRDDDYDLPYWELFIPKGRMIAFGPNQRWSIGPSETRRRA